jgi:hypothetical protein
VPFRAARRVRRRGWEQIAILGDVANVGVQTKHRSAFVEDGTIRGGHQPRGEAQQRGLAAARRTDDGRDLSGRNIEADAVERENVLLLTCKGKPNVRELYRRWFRGAIYRVHEADPCIASLRCHAFIRFNCRRPPRLLRE